MLDRSVAPEAKELVQLDIPKPKIVHLSSGIPLLLMVDSNHPVISLEIILESGRLFENAEELGNSYFTSKMLTEGTHAKSAAEIAKELDFVGSFLEIVPGIDSVTIKLHALKKFFSASADLLFEILENAAFPKREFEILKDIRIHNIRSQLANNNQLAQVSFLERLFGGQHPYGRLISPEIVQESLIEEAEQFYRNKLFNNAKLLLIGDVTNEVSWVDKKLNQLDFHQLRPESQSVSTSSGIETILKDNSTQASIRVGDLCPSRTENNIHLINISNMLLGGFFGSRLMKNIREEKGLTYGIHSQISHQKKASFWMVSSEVKKEDASQVLEEIQSEIDLLIQEGVTDRELLTLRNYAKGKLLSAIDSPFSLAAMYKVLFLNDISFDYHQEYLDTLEIVSSEDVSNICNRYFSWNTGVIVS